MSPLQIPFDDNCLAHTANYWAFDYWGETDLGREDRFAEAAHLILGVDSGYVLPAC